MVQPEHITQLMEHIEGVLRRRPEGLSEYALLCELREAEAPLMQRCPAHDTVALFRQHFVLMHCLYRMQVMFERRHQGELHISPLRIRLQPPPPAARPRQALGDFEPVKAYYLDLGHLQATGEKEVSALLEGFWRRYLGGQQRQEALQELGLTDPVEARDIKRRYRQLAMEHHPDRGGQTARLQRLHEAMRILRADGAV